MADRTERIRFELLNLNLDLVGGSAGEIHPVADEVARIDNDVTRSIKRTLTNLVLPMAELAKIDPVEHLIRPVWEIDGIEHYCGAFIPGDVTERVTSEGIGAAMGNCDDQCSYFDEETRGGGVAQEEYISEAMRFFVAARGVTQLSIEFSPNRPYIPMGPWEPGTNGIEIVDEMALGANQWWYFANPGTYVARSILDPASEKPDFRYVVPGGPSDVIRDSYERRKVLRNATNTYLVVATGAADIELAGEFHVPSEAPHSRENRGREVLRVIPMQGIASNADAAEKAFFAWISDAEASYEFKEFDTVANPAHDTYAIVEVEERNHLELRTTLELTVGGNHHHVCARKVWP